MVILWKYYLETAAPAKLLQYRLDWTPLTFWFLLDIYSFTSPTKIFDYQYGSILSFKRTLALLNTYLCFLSKGDYRKRFSLVSTNISRMHPLYPIIIIIIIVLLHNLLFINYSYWGHSNFFCCNIPKDSTTRTMFLFFADVYLIFYWD